MLSLYVMLLCVCRISQTPPPRDKIFRFEDVELGRKKGPAPRACRRQQKPMRHMLITTAACRKLRQFADLVNETCKTGDFADLRLSSSLSLSGSMGGISLSTLPLTLLLCIRTSCFEGGGGLVEEGQIEFGPFPSTIYTTNFHSSSSSGSKGWVGWWRGGGVLVVAVFPFTLFFLLSLSLSPSLSLCFFHPLSFLSLFWHQQR